MSISNLMPFSLYPSLLPIFTVSTVYDVVLNIGQTMILELYLCNHFFALKTEGCVTKSNSIYCSMFIVKR